MAMLLLLLLALPSTLLAAVDGRFAITMPISERSDWRSVVDDGMDRVLDRLLPQDERGHVTLKGARYLLRAIPEDHTVALQFRRAALLHDLQRRGMHPIIEPPRIDLRLAMQDVRGHAMPQTVALLRQEAEMIATRWGIVLVHVSSSSPGDALRLEWRWVDDHWLRLTVLSGDGSLASMGGESRVDAEQPMVQLRARLSRILLRARDSIAASARDQGEVAAISAPLSATHAMVITIHRPATLSEQVGLEQVLLASPQVHALIPLVLSRQWQRYQLEVDDEQWVGTWFASRGMQATMRDDGWEVR